MHRFDASRAEAGVALVLRTSKLQVNGRLSSFSFHFLSVGSLRVYLLAELYELAMTFLAANNKTLIQTNLDKNRLIELTNLRGGFRQNWIL